MANKLETTQVTFNDEKITCARFTIDDISVPFVLKNIAVTGKDYTFSLYLKSNGDSSISVEGNNITSTTAWTRQYVTFSATKANVEISFNKTGTYYFYNTQLETGKICSDWTPNPEDISEDVLNAETIAKQTATKFSWLVKNGTSESNFELTDRTISLISKNINLNGIVTFMNTAKGEVYKNLYASTGYADFESIKSTDDAICYAKLDSNSVAIDSSTYWCGSNSLKISGTAKNLVRVYLGNKENNYGCIKVEQGKTYQITAYVKSDSEQNVSFGIDWITHGTKIDAATGTCYIESYLFNPQRPSFPKGCTTITPNTSWQRAITTFTVTDKTNSYYYISIVPTIYNQLSKNANFWVDGIMVEEVESLNSEPNEFTNSAKATIIDGNSILTDSITADKLTANSITAEKIMADALKSKNYVVGESGSFLNLADGSFDSKYLKWDSVGKITVSMGNIANWNINSTSIYKGDGWKSSTSGSAYFGDNGLSITDKFLVDSSGNVSTSNIVITGGSINISNGNFIADSKGNVEMKGKVTSSSGNIAGWEITSDSFYKDTDDYTVYVCPGTNNNKDFLTIHDKNKSSGDEWPFYVHADGWMHCVYGDIGGWNIDGDGLNKTLNYNGLIDATKSDSSGCVIPEGRKLSININTKISKEPAGSIVERYDYKEYEKIENILSFSNLSNSTSKDKINKYFNISDDCSITIKSLSSGQGNSYMKLFSDSFYIGNKNYVRKASVFQTSLCVENETIITRNTASFGGTIYIPNDRYIRQKTPKGFEASLVGWSKGNNIWLGDYGVMGSKQIATNAYIAANNIYKTTSSGSTSLSDERYKHDFKDINSALDFIMNLNPCLFKFNDGTSNRYHMGFKAQEVEKNMLNTIGDTGLTVKYNCEEGLNVDLNNPDTYILGLRYEEFIAPLIQVVQNQQKQISELKKKIDTLSNQV